MASHRATARSPSRRLFRPSAGRPASTTISTSTCAAPRPSPSAGSCAWASPKAASSTGSPPHAAVHLSVELARMRFGKGPAGLVNAVLRRAITASWKDPAGDDPSALAIRHSHPEWLVRRWIKRHGVETATTMLEAGSRDPEAWVRVRAGASNLPWDPAAETARLHDGFFRRLSIGRERVLGSDSFRDGFVSFQDPSSGACALALSGFLRPGMVVADLCAAPGGKLACLHDHGDLEGVRSLAFDLSLSRQLRSVDGFRRLHLECLAGVADATRPPLRESSVDAILVDAPCSNLGVLSRRPEARWRIRPDDPRTHGKLQRRMLKRPSPASAQADGSSIRCVPRNPRKGRTSYGTFPDAAWKALSRAFLACRTGTDSFSPSSCVSRPEAGPPRAPPCASHCRGGPPSLPLGDIFRREPASWTSSTCPSKPSKSN